MDNDKKWTMQQNIFTEDDDYQYTSRYNNKLDPLSDPITLAQNTPTYTITYDSYAVEEFENELLRDKYPELFTAWEHYQKLLEKYRMWDKVTNTE